MYTGDLETGRTMFERAVDRARQLNDAETEGFTLAWEADLGVIAGDPEMVLTLSQRSVELAEKLGSSFACAFAFLHLGIGLLMSGKPREAVESLEHALTTAREHNTCLEEVPRMVGWLAEAKLEVGEPEQARTLSEEAVHLSRETGAHLNLMWTLCSRARVLLETGGLDASEKIGDVLDEAERTIRETGAKNLRPRVLRLSAELARLRGDPEARERILREAHDLLMEMGASEGE